MSVEASPKSARLSIGQLARRAGASVPTVRYYEQVGLLPAAPRTDAGQRRYDESAVRRLALVRRCRDFGFSIEQIRGLVALVDESQRPCADLREIAAGHLADVRRRLEELQSLEAGLQAFVRDCDVACLGGRALDCTILRELSSPPGPDRRAGGGGCCDRSATVPDTGC